MFSIAIDQPFRFPASFTFVLRAFTTLEGLGRTLDPDYKFAAVAQPYALQLLQLQVKALDAILSITRSVVCSKGTPSTGISVWFALGLHDFTPGGLEAHCRPRLQHRYCTSALCPAVLAASRKASNRLYSDHSLFWHCVVRASVSIWCGVSRERHLVVFIKV